MNKASLYSNKFAAHTCNNLNQMGTPLPSQKGRKVLGDDIEKWKNKKTPKKNPGKSFSGKYLKVSRSLSLWVATKSWKTSFIGIESILTECPVGFKSEWSEHTEREKVSFGEIHSSHTASPLTMMTKISSIFCIVLSFYFLV